MRTALALSLLLTVGCHDDTGRLDAHEGIQHALEERVGKLESHLGAIDPEAAAGRAVAPLSDRVAKLEARVGAVEAAMAAIPKPSPELHLFAAGEDLGRWTGGLTSFSPKYGAVVDWSVAATAYYASDDCTGDDVCLVNTSSTLLPGMVAITTEGAATYIGKATTICHSVRDGDSCNKDELNGGVAGRLFRDGARSVRPQDATVRPM